MKAIWHWFTDDYPQFDAPFLTFRWFLPGIWYYLSRGAALGFLAWILESLWKAVVAHA